MAKPRVVVIGAGLAGLTAAWHLQRKGYDPLVLEREHSVGGLCRSFQLNGFTFDCDAHLLHFRHPAMLQFVRRLLRGNLEEHARNARVYCGGAYIPYPFQANLYGLPHPVAKACLLGLIRARKNGQAVRYDTFLQWIRGTFGAGIARHFMVPYNAKFWTVHPSRLTCEWLEGFIPVPSLAQVVEGTVEESRRQFGYNARFWYPARGGIACLPEALAAGIPAVRTGVAVKRIDAKEKMVHCANGTAERYDWLVSTVPLPEVSALIPDLPVAVRSQAARLRWNSIFNVNLGIRRVDTSRRHWVYFSEKDFSFFRVGYYSNFSRGLAPAGMTSLYTEVAYSRTVPLERHSLMNRILKDLRRANIIAPGDEVCARQVNDIRYGYPLYDRHYRGARAGVLSYLQRRGIVSCGRYGSWRYMSMEDVMLEGAHVAARIARG